METTIEVAQYGNPFLPMWEQIPDAEPRVFLDPETKEERVYLYGSHDISPNHAWCGDNYVVWSAPVDNLMDWRYEGISICTQDLEGMPYQNDSGEEERLVIDEAHTLYAPDVVYCPQLDKYILFGFLAGAEPSNIMFTAQSDTPAGPFTNPAFLGYGFDPAVLVDGDVMYLYYTIEEEHRLYVTEMDELTLALIPETTQELMGLTDEPFFLVEGPSIRKIGDVYVLSFARSPEGNIQVVSEIAYATSQFPDKDFEYRGIIIANDGLYEYGTDEKTFFGGNNHGGLFEADGQWYQVYHKTTKNNLKRQTMVTPVRLHDENGDVTIERATLNSTGFYSNGLNPFSGIYAADFCYVNPVKGIKIHTNDELDFDPASDRPDYYPVTGISNGTMLGYTWFDFTIPQEDLTFAVSLKQLQPLRINIYAADYNETVIGSMPDLELIGTIALSDETIKDEEQVVQTTVSDITGAKSIYLEFVSEAKGELCELNKIIFWK